MNASYIGIIAGAFAVTSATAIADDDASNEGANNESAEETTGANQSWVVSDLTNDKGEPWGSALITTSEHGREVGFRCLDGKLLAAFALEDSDLMTAFKKAGPQKTVRINVTINGGEAERQDWILLRRHKVVAAGDHNLTRRLYNAMVRNENVTIEGRSGGGEYVMPAPDAAAFASFMNTCNFSAKKS